MYNYFMLMGRTLEKPKIEEFEDGKKKCVIKLKVIRPFSVDNGNGEADVFNVTFRDYTTFLIEDSNLKKGSPIVIKGRMESNEQGIELIGERIMFF